MATNIYGAVAFGVTVMLVLTFAELPSASAIHDQDQRPAYRRATPAAGEDAKERERRRLVHYVLPNASGHAVEIARHMSEVFDEFGGRKAWREVSFQ
jgi:hypothetical protein